MMKNPTIVVNPINSKRYLAYPTMFIQILSRFAAISGIGVIPISTIKVH